MVFAERFESGVWKDWEHTCDEGEIEAVEDSARAKAFDRGNFNGEMVYIDYLKGAEYVFDVARGERSSPVEGDMKVYGVTVDDIVIAKFERLKHHFEMQKIA